MIYMDQKGRDENKDQLQGRRRRRRDVNVQRILVSSGQDTEVSMGGGEVREATSHPSWEGTGSTVAFVGF